jgi:hypothetical protein
VARAITVIPACFHSSNAKIILDRNYGVVITRLVCDKGSAVTLQCRGTNGQPREV